MCIRDRFGIHLARPLIIAGTEGRGIELKGRWLPGGWQFFCEAASDAWVSDVDDADESESGLPGQVQNAGTTVSIEGADSWPDALVLMDRNPWHTLVPVYVHPELREHVWDPYEHRWAHGCLLYTCKCAQDT